MRGLLIDEMLPPTTAELLRREGHSAFHVSEVGLQGADDPYVGAHWPQPQER